ncbi:DUF4270 domain-containing protein [Flavobacterium sp. U410]
MKKKKIFGLLGFGLLSLVSCDKDFSTVGADLIGDGNYQFDKEEWNKITAFTRATGPVQSNNMPLNALGVFQDPVFGTTTAHFVTQLELENTNPNFFEEAEIQATDSVYLYIPYFSTLEDTDTDGNNTYSLDSIHGNLSESFDLKIYESKYLLQSYDPLDPTQAQKYYSSEKALIENHLNLDSGPLNVFSGASSNQNTQFKFSRSEIIIYETDDDGNYLDSGGNITTDPDTRVVKERLEPGMWINLNKEFFEEKILQNATSENLFNNNNFKEYFRGLYFQVTQNSGGALAMLDFSSGYIVMQFHTKYDSSSEFIKSEIQINLAGNTVNFFDNNTSTATSGNYQSALTSQNANDDLLYLKGGDGSVAYIDLFGNDDDANNNEIPDKLEELRNSGWLINDVILTLTIANKNNKINTEGTTLNDGYDLGEEPLRLYLFDANANTVLLDYTYDSTTATDAKFNKYLLGGIIEQDEISETTKEGRVYRFRLLHYFNNLMQTEDEDALKNIRLGLVVTETINNVSNYSLMNAIGNLPSTLPLASSVNTIDKVPLANIMNPLGTVIYGVNHTDDSKRMKLEIYYTKPNSN